MLSGDNGVLQRATDAKTKSDEAQIREKIQLAYHSALTKDITGENGELTMLTLQAELENEFTGKTVTITPSSDNKEWTIKVDDVEENVPAGKSVVIAEVKDKNGIVIASTTETTPFLPDPENNEITNNDLNSGLTIKDGNNNEWVWIEVPRSVTAGATDDAGIKSALENYIYVQNAKNTNGTDAEVPLLTKTDGTESTKNNKTTTVGYTDTWYDGCGLSSGDYATKYSTMLNSIKANGGFYIGKYEAGYELPEGSTNFRSDSNKSSTSDHTAVTKQDAYPYNYVTCSQAEDLAEGFATGTKTTTLMFGIQWDLVLKHLNNKGVSVADLTSDSGDWGNYYDTNKTFTVTRGKYWDFMNQAAGFVTLASGSSKTVPSYAPVALSTGATTRNMKKNIYDLAGNMNEWTLENTSSSNLPCAFRGGYFSDTGYPASYRGYVDTTYSIFHSRFPCFSLLELSNV